MSKTATTLSKAIEAVQELPEDAQAAIAHDIEMQVAAYTKSHLTDEQRAIVRERLNRPQTLVTPEALQKTLDRYKLA